MGTVLTKGSAPAPMGSLSLELLGAAPALRGVGDNHDSDSLSQARPLLGG